MPRWARTGGWSEERQRLHDYGKQSGSMFDTLTATYTLSVKERRRLMRRILKEAGMMSVSGVVSAMNTELAELGYPPLHYDDVAPLLREDVRRGLLRSVRSERQDRDYFLPLPDKKSGRPKGVRGWKSEQPKVNVSPKKRKPRRKSTSEESSSTSTAH